MRVFFVFFFFFKKKGCDDLDTFEVVWKYDEIKKKSCCCFVPNVLFISFISWRVYEVEIPTRIFTLPSIARSKNNTNNKPPRDNNNRSKILRVLWLLMLLLSLL